MIRWNCTICDTDLEADNADAGKGVECPKCRAAQVAPASFSVPKNESVPFRRMRDRFVMAAIAAAACIFIIAGVIWWAFHPNKTQTSNELQKESVRTNARCAICGHSFYLPYKNEKAEWLVEASCPECHQNFMYGLFHHWGDPNAPKPPSQLLDMKVPKN